MKKLIIGILLCMNFVSVGANAETPTYKITANSNTAEDIQEMYETKEALLKDYITWVKGIDDVEQALADHAKCYQAKYYNGTYEIVLGKGNGKEITGKLQTSYCTSGKEIQKKSWFEELFS